MAEDSERQITPKERALAAAPGGLGLGAALLDFFAFGGVPAATGTLNAGSALFNANRGDSSAAAKEEMARQQDKIDDLQDRMQRQEISSQEIRARLTALQRAINEGGRHPELEMRRALGVLGARLFLDDESADEDFELSDVMTRCTSSDVSFLQATQSLGRKDSYATTAPGVEGEWLNEEAGVKAYRAKPEYFGWVQVEAVARVWGDSNESSTTLLRAHARTERLERLGLIEALANAPVPIVRPAARLSDAPQSVFLTPLSRRLLSLIRLPDQAGDLSTV